MIATRQCEGCGLTLVRHVLPSGRLEQPLKFAQRRTCGRACGSRLPRVPRPPAPAMSFAASYRAALAAGFDPFELADAHWGD
jgi:hypothetical protein